MSNLVKIREISGRYNVSARTLRYYEDMGLIESTRSDDYAYRLYDEAAIKRLEQILILRRLNISIKDIKRIFDTTGSHKIEKWIERTNFVIDDSRATSVHMIYVDDEIKKGLGYHQLNFYAPIKLKNDC